MEMFLLSKNVIKVIKNLYDLEIICFQILNLLNNVVRDGSIMRGKEKKLCRKEKIRTINENILHNFGNEIPVSYKVRSGLYKGLNQ